MTTDRHTLNKGAALVTGASRGIGAAIARGLAARGFGVTLTYLNGADDAARIVAEIVEAGGAARAVAADCRDEAAMRNAVADTERHWGRLDVLVLNATGPQPMIPLDGISWNDAVQQLEYFVKGPLIATQAAVPGMKERGHGRIIHIGTELLANASTMMAHYVAAKSAQLGLMRASAAELARSGITVNMVSPGWVLTERHGDVPMQAIRGYAASVPLGRMGTGEDIAGAVAFLAGDDASFMTGREIVVNGGR